VLNTWRHTAPSSSSLDGRPAAELAIVPLTVNVQTDTLNPFKSNVAPAFTWTESTGDPSPRAIAAFSVPFETMTPAVKD